MPSIRNSTRGNVWYLRLLIIVLTTVNDSLLVLSTPASSVNRLSEHNRISMPRAVATSRKFPCREPQPRAYHLRDLVQSMKLLNPGDSANQPIYIVVKRCDGHSGCCMSSDMTCTPVGNLTYHEDVEIEVWSLRSNESRRQWISVEQHAKCSCELTNSDERAKLETQKPNVMIVSDSPSDLRHKRKTNG